MSKRVTYDVVATCRNEVAATSHFGQNDVDTTHPRPIKIFITFISDVHEIKDVDSNKETPRDMPE